MSVAAAGIDCRGKTATEAGRAIIGRYNSLAAGTRFDALVDALPAELKIWLLEAGARHRAERRDDGAWRLAITRGVTPAQGSILGLHHVVSDGASVWTCERGAHAVRIDAASRTVAAVGLVARKASHLAHHAQTQRLFVADSEADEVIMLRAADLAVEQRWAAPGGPQLPVVSSAGIACVSGPATGTLTIARPRGNGYAAQTLVVGANPHDPLIGGDEAHVFVPCAGDGSVVKVRLADGAVVGRCNVGDGPSHVAASADGGRLFVANSWDGTVTCFSADGEVLRSKASGGWAHAIDIAPDGKWVYVANFLDDTLAVFAAETLERVALLPTDPYPHGLDVTPDGRQVIVAGFGGDTVRLFDAAAHHELARIEVGLGASHAAYAAGDAFIACSVADHVAAVQLDQRRVDARISIH